MSLLKDFLYDFQYSLESKLEILEPEVETDFSNFTVVDGEEGDFGTIKYTHNGVLIATKVVHGGDREEYDWTVEGRNLMVDLLAAAITSLGT
jgi:hypothetical protein